MAKKTKELKPAIVSNSLIQRIIKDTGNIHADTLQDSEIINNKDFFSTPIYGMNIALGGTLNGGMNPGLLQIVGESKSFKTLFMLILAKAYLDTNGPDSVFVLFDSEFGASLEYFESVGIDPKRVIHCPIETVEDLRGQANMFLDKVTRGEKIFVGIDSIGLLASNKEVNDAISGNEAADMTRAKALNSFFRTVIGKLVPLDIPMVIVNHSYDSIGGFIATKIVKGGKGGYLASNDIWMITRAQDSEAQSGETKKKLVGYKFTIWIEKSRTVKEKSKVPIMVSFDGGVDKYSGLLDIALEGGFITKPTKQKYEYNGTIVDDEDETTPFIVDLVANAEFAAYVKDKYKQAGKKLIQTPEE